MNFITTGAILDRAPQGRTYALRASMPHGAGTDLPHPPYAFLSTRDLRGLVAAMVD